MTRTMNSRHEREQLHAFMTHAHT